MVTFNRMNNNAFATPQEYDSYLSDPYYNTPTDEYVTNMADEPWRDENLDNMGEGGQVPVLSVGEYEKDLLSQAKQIRGDASLSASEKKLLLDRINKLLSSLKKVSNKDVPPPEVLSEIESFQMERMEQEARAIEEANAQYEELYGKLTELRANVEATEETSYSFTEEQRKDYLTQIDQMMHSLDLGEKPEEVSKKLEELEVKLNACVVDEKTQTFLSLFTDPQVTVQELKDAGIYDEIKNNHGEMPSEKVIQFLTEHDSSLKGFITNEDYEGAMERISSLLNTGFGISLGNPDEEEAKAYGLKNQGHLFKLGSKIYAIDLSGGTLKLTGAAKLKEVDLAVEEIAENLANLPGLHDVDATYIIEKAKELNFDLANLPPVPTAEVFTFLAHISPKLQKAVETYIASDNDAAYAAVRNALTDGLQALYGKDVVSIDSASEYCSDDIIFNGVSYDVLINYGEFSPVIPGSYETYANIFRMSEDDG